MIGKRSFYSLIVLMVLTAILTACSAPKAAPANPAQGGSGSSPLSGSSGSSSASNNNAYGSSAQATAKPAAATAVPAKPTEALLPVSGGDPNSVLEKMYAALLAAKAYQGRVTIQNLTDNSTNSMVTTFVAPDNYSIQSKETNMVITGGKTYMKLKDQNKWIESPINMGNLISSFRNIEFMKNYTKYNRNVALVGPDMIDGKPVMVYSFDSTFESVDATNKVWLGADFLPYKMESHSKTVDGKDVVTTILYTFDPNISVPDPTKP